MSLPFLQSSTAFGYRSTSPCEFAQIIWKAFPFLREWTFLLESTGIQNSVSKIRCLLITFDLERSPPLYLNPKSALALKAQM
jgi:hypothetical protein